MIPTKKQMKIIRKHQGTDWFWELAKRLATDEDFVKVYMESLNSDPFTGQAQKEIAKWLKSGGDDMFDYLLDKHKRGDKQ